MKQRSITDSVTVKQTKEALHQLQLFNQKHNLKYQLEDDQLKYLYWFITKFSEQILARVPAENQTLETLTKIKVNQYQKYLHYLATAPKRHSIA